MWPTIDQEPQKHPLYQFIRRSLQVRKQLSDSSVIPGQRVEDKLADERTYAFARGEGCQIVVAVSNQV